MNASTLAPAVTRRILVAAFVVILALLGVGYWYYRAEVQAIRQQEYEELASIAKLKAGQIGQWRKERLMDVTREANSPTLITALGKIAENAETPEARDEVMKVLALARNGPTYANAIVLSPSGQVLFSAGDGPVSIEAATQRAVEAARANPGGVISDFFRTPKGEVDIDAVEAVRDAGGNTLGFIILRSRAADYLYPLIQSWPTPSRSAETLLVEREGENALFLNELRHRSKTALSMHDPIKQTNLPAAQAVLGRHGMFDGKDYRNVEVLADLSSIPGTPWFMVAKVDRDEIMAEASYRAASIGVIVGALILLTALAAAFAYKQQHARLLWKLFESERHQRETEELFRATLYSIADGVLTADTSGHIQEMNRVAERLTGWTEAEARGKPLDEVFVIINQATRATVPNPAATVLREGAVVGLGNHTLLIARDGSECPIADSAAPIRDESGVVRGVVLVFSDATAQDDLRKEQQFSKLVLDNLPGIFYLYSYPENRLILWNKQHESLLGYTSEEMKGRHATDWFALEDKEAILNAIEGVMEKGQNSIEAPMVAKDGHRVPLLLTGVKFESRNKSYFIGIGTDITERKEAEEALRESEAQLRYSLKAASAGVWDLDIRSGVLVWSPENYALFGCDPAQGPLSFASWEACVYPEDRAQAVASINDVIDGRVSELSIEFRIIRPENQVRWLVGLGKMERAPDGTPVRMSGINLDITKRKQAEEELKTILRTTMDGFYLVDLEGRILETNDSYCSMIGYSREELLAMSIKDVEAIDTDEVIKNRIKQIMATGHARFETKHKRKDGRIIVIEVSCNYLPFEKKRLFCFMRDITERKRAEWQNLRLASLVNFSQDFIGFATLDGIGLFLNAGARKLVGLGETDPCPRVIEHLMPEDRPYVEQTVLPALFREGRWIGEFNFFHFITHKPIAMMWDLFLIYDPETGKPLHIATVSKDIRELKRNQSERERFLEEMRVAKEMAETANQAKDQFIAMLSHELRTPLTPILLSSAAMEAEEEVPEGFRTELEIIRRNVELETKLIDDLLDVTRISRGMIQLHQEVVDAHACLRNALEICQSEITTKRLNVSLRLDADQPHVWADPARLQQVFWNLLRNAVKFTPEGGAISIRSANIDDRLHMEFSDTGIGIDPAVLPRIFNAFEQAEQGKARHFGGLGLGLSIAKAVVDLHHGTLAAFSEGTDKGTTFTLEMATVPEAKEPPVALCPTPFPSRESKAILLVEDNADTLRILAKMLQKWGYTVRTADCVRRALEEAAKEPFDLLVSDIGLPDGSGLEIMQQVKNLYGVSGVAISGFGTEEDIRQSRAAGFGEHLVKPVGIQALHEAIQRIASEAA